MELIEEIKTWPRDPGVYLMKDRHGVVLYVGKAVDLRARIANYFRGRSASDACDARLGRVERRRIHRGTGVEPPMQLTQDSRYQVAFLMRRVAALDYIVAASEKEALLLEYTLIQKHKPKYNIFWKDDKSYVRVRLTTPHPFPGIYTTRQVVKDGARYFGPYVSATACRETVESIVRHCRLRTCSDREFANRARPCIEYQIGRCTAPCVAKVSQADYAAQVRQAVLLLEGRTSEVKTELERGMASASEAQRYEEAAKLRDRLRAIEETLESQQMVREREVDEDWLGWASGKGRAVVSLLMVRGGRVQDRIVSIETQDPSGGAEVVERFLLQYYQAPVVPPPVIYWPFETPPSAALAQILSERRGGRVAIRHPRRGKAREFMKLAQANADSILSSRGSDEDRLNHSLVAVERGLHLPQYPYQIECIDISNWDGEQATGAIVVFQEGQPAKSEYRHYSIKGPHQPNDYAMMYETLARRYARHPVPQLLLVDGGKGQLQVALKVMADLRLPPFSVAAIAKGRPRIGVRGRVQGPDRIFLPNRKNPLPLKAGAPALLLLQRIRDAAHHFGNSFVRRKMRKTRLPKR